LVSKQLVTYLKDNGLLPKLQSGFHAYHSTETAVLKVVGDILHALDTGNIALLTLLDLSAAFDSVDHSILLQRPSRNCYWLVCFVPYWSKSARLHSSIQIHTVICLVRRAARVGPRADHVCLVCR